MYFRAVLVSHDHSFRRSRVCSEDHAILRKGRTTPRARPRPRPRGARPQPRARPRRDSAGPQRWGPARCPLPGPAGSPSPPLTLKTTPAMVVPVLRAAGSRCPFWASSASRSEFLQHRASAEAGRGVAGTPPAPSPEPRSPPAPSRPLAPRPGRPAPHRAQLSKLKPPRGACSTDTAAISSPSRAVPGRAPARAAGPLPGPGPPRGPAGRCEMAAGPGPAPRARLPPAPGVPGRASGPGCLRVPAPLSALGAGGGGAAAWGEGRVGARCGAGGSVSPAGWVPVHVQAEIMRK